MPLNVLHGNWSYTPMPLDRGKTNSLQGSAPVITWSSGNLNTINAFPRWSAQKQPCLNHISPLGHLLSPKPHFFAPSPPRPPEYKERNKGKLNTPSKTECKRLPRGPSTCLLALSPVRGKVCCPQTRPLKFRNCHLRYVCLPGHGSLTVISPGQVHQRLGPARRSR